jgi:hypothetical protein
VPLNTRDSEDSDSLCGAYAMALPSAGSVVAHCTVIVAGLVPAGVDADRD